MKNYEAIATYEKYNTTYFAMILWLAIVDLMIVIFMYINNRDYFRDRKRMRMYVGER